MTATMTGLDFPERPRHEPATRVWRDQLNDTCKIMTGMSLVEFLFEWENGVLPTEGMREFASLVPQSWFIS